VEFPHGVTVGGEKVAVMAGPCSIENREQMFETAARVKAAGASFLRGGAVSSRAVRRTRFRGWDSGPRTDARGGGGPWAADGNRGDGDLADRVDVPYTDLFQVGARNMQNFNLLRELGQVRKPILLKRGLRPRLRSCCCRASTSCRAGNYDAEFWCERGIRTYGNGRRGIGMDISAIPVVHKLSQPADHRRSVARDGTADMVGTDGAGCCGCGGRRHSCRGASQCGQAASDAAQTLYLEQFEALMGELR